MIYNTNKNNVTLCGVQSVKQCPYCPSKSQEHTFVSVKKTLSSYSLAFTAEIRVHC